ncbi:MAG: Xaa-Pro aminopeptidase [Sandaracinus sp.]
MTSAPSPAFAAELAQRRTAFLERLGPGAVAIVASAPVHVRNNDVEHPYRQDSDFFYLTGLDEPESLAVFSNVHGKHRFVLFVRPKDPERETWDGPRVGVDAAPMRFACDAAFPNAERNERLPSYLENARTLHFALGRDPATDAQVLRARDLVRRRARLGVLYPATLVDLSATVHPMRLFKSEGEIAIMRRAAEVSREAHARAMSVARPGVLEYEVEAEMLRSFRRHGAERPAYEPIVGSGPNATILHYRKNDRRLEDGDLLLIDAGCELEYYASDVTRTFPVSGRFTPAQRRIYDVVLRAQELAIAATRPGATLESIHRLTLRSITEGLIDLGLVEGPLDTALEKELYKPFSMHRTSHWLGMDVHDVGSYFVEDGASPPVPRVLEPGQVLTVEPGIYVGATTKAPDEYKGIGVRIEDDVLVTADGPDVLTRGIPKKPGELEQTLAAR